MASEVRLEGLGELREALRQMPEAIRGEAREIVIEEATGAAVEIEQQYPVRDYGKARGRGNLRRKVRVEAPSSTVIAAIVHSDAPESHLYEFGTQVRRTATGANRGASPPHPVTVPIARKRRARMVRRLVELVQRNGFEVTGE